MEKSSTSKFQKIAIWAILIALSIGSVGAYFVVILANNNAKTDQENLAKAQKQQQAQAAAANQPLKGYKATPFKKASVKKLKVQQLVAGSGKKASKTSKVTVNYFGWTSNGKIFDSSRKSGKTKPVSFPLNQVIPGWTEGLTGIKAGSTVKLLIPGAKAYGAKGIPQGGIGPNEPLVFVIELMKVE